MDPIEKLFGVFDEESANLQAQFDAQVLTAVNAGILGHLFVLYLMKCDSAEQAKTHGDQMLTTVMNEVEKQLKSELIDSEMNQYLMFLSK